MIAPFVTGVAFGLGGLFGELVFAGGEVPGFALGAEIGAEKRGVRSVTLDAVTGLPCLGLAGVTGFPAWAGVTEGRWRFGRFKSGGGFVRIERIRGESELGEQFVDALVGLGFHQGEEAGVEVSKGM